MIAVVFSCLIISSTQFRVAWLQVLTAMKITALDKQAYSLSLAC